MNIFKSKYAFGRFISVVVLVCLALAICKPTYALDFYDYLKLNITPIPCSGNPSSSCPTTRREAGSNETIQNLYGSDLGPYDTTQTPRRRTGTPTEPAEACAGSYNDTASTPFISNPGTLHYWVEDPEITALGKASERSRQFINWAISRQAIDQALPLKQIWSMNRNIAISLMILVSTVLGLAIIVGNKLRSGYSFSVRSSIIKIGLSMLYIAFSATIIFTLISLSDILMKFFIESLGGDRIFNTYFISTSGESNYTGFVGCRDINIRVHEAIQAEMFLLKLSNITHYMMGVMLILRKIILWFMLFVSPFLPLLMSFPLIKNTGKIWIGVFFQWLFYGPLFALFLGATAKLFTDGIPFIFDFSRIEKAIGYIFPTAMIITYGGPAQRLNAVNNGNYIDTFAEYVITMILFWAATWFPWWLLRIFRDYCCDGIYAMRNALYGFLDKTTKPPPHGPTPIQPTQPTKFEPTPELKIPQPTTVIQKEQKVIRLDNFNMVRQAKTEEIVSTMNLKASTLRDVARLETNKTSVQTAKMNFALLTNPLAATTSAERQKYLNIRTELFTRATTKNDMFAQYVLSTTNRASQTYISRRNEIAKSLDSVISNINKTSFSNLSQSTSQATHISSDKVNSVTNSVISNIVNNQTALQSIANGAHTTIMTTKQVLQTYAQNISQPFNQIISKISESTEVSKDKVREVLKETQTLIENAKSVTRIAHIVTVDKTHSAQVLNQINNFVSNISSNAISSISGISQSANTMGNQLITRVSQTVLNMARQEPAIISQITNNTQVVADKVMQTLQSVSERGTTAIHDIITKVNLTEKQIQEILVQTSKIVETRQPAEIKDIAPPGVSLEQIIQTTIQSEALRQINQTNLNQLQELFKDATVASFTKELLKRSQTDEQLITSLQEITNLSKKQIEETISTLSEASTITDKAVLDKLKTEKGVESDKAMTIVREAVKHAQLAKSVVAPNTEDNLDEASLILVQQLNTALNPESQIDQIIPLPEDEQSLGEYEEIRQLWVNQYQDGDVPVSETIHTRLDWVSQDVEVITEIMTKLVSTNETMRQQALDEIGFILPVFLMNNLSGNQLITYLKAKLSAAKEVKLLLEQKQAEEEENLVEVTHQATAIEENTKHMEVDEEGEVHTVEDEQKVE